MNSFLGHTTVYRDTSWRYPLRQGRAHKCICALLLVEFLLFIKPLVSFVTYLLILSGPFLPTSNWTDWQTRRYIDQLFFCMTVCVCVVSYLYILQSIHLCACDHLSSTYISTHACILSNDALHPVSYWSSLITRMSSMRSRSTWKKGGPLLYG